MKKFSAFTLAEVLITLGIIGVVAAMTMPTLINQTNGAQYRAAFKKELSVISQAVTLNVALEDFDFADLTTSDTTGMGTLTTMLKNRTNVVRVATKDDIGSDYVPQAAPATNVSYDNAARTNNGNNAPQLAIDGWDTALMFNDGSMFMYKAADVTGCTAAENGTGTAKVCYGWFDVNGMKGPNKETRCDSTTTNDTCTVKIPTDIFPVKFFDQTILPASNAGRAVLYDNGNTATRADGAGTGAGAGVGG